MIEQAEAAGLSDGEIYAELLARGYHDELEKAKQSFLERMKLSASERRKEETKGNGTS